MKKDCKISKKLIIVLIVFLIIIPFVLTCNFQIKESCLNITLTRIKASDKLDFYGTLLSFVSTTFLGWIAIWQNKQLQKIEEDNQNLNKSCNIYISIATEKPTKQLSNDFSNYKESLQRLEISLSNHSEAFLKNIELQFDDKIIFKSNLTLIKGKDKSFYVFMPDNFNVEDKIIKIIFTSCYETKTYADMQITSKNNKNFYPKYYHFYGVDSNCISLND